MSEKSKIVTRSGDKVTFYMKNTDRAVLKKLSKRLKLSLSATVALGIASLSEREGLF